MLIPNREGNAERRRRELTMRYAVGNDLNSEALSIADCLVRRLAIRHYARKLEGLSNPAPVVLPLELDRELHLFIIAPRSEEPYQVRFMRTGFDAEKFETCPRWGVPSAVGM